MSFVRLFDDTKVGWQLRGQYAFWNGVSHGGEKHALLEKVGRRVARIRYENGDPVFHQIKAGTVFTVQGMIGFWVSFDTDTMWLDVPKADGRYSVLAVGGAAGKPGSATIEWVCPKCGNALSPKTLEIAPRNFPRFLKQADAWADEFNADAAYRTCGACGTVHPTAPGLIQDPPAEPAKPALAASGA